MELSINVAEKPKKPDPRQMSFEFMEDEEDVVDGDDGDSGPASSSDDDDEPEVDEDCFPL
jgi:hypothetical protein